MVKVKTVKVDGYTFPASITGLALAVESDHPNCTDTTCDISHANSERDVYGGPFAPITAARLLQGATECPTVDAVLGALVFNGENVGMGDPMSAPDWSRWEAWHDAHKMPTCACGAINYVTDANYPPERCGSCGAELDVPTPSA